MATAPVKTKRPAKSERTHVRRVKEIARKEGVAPSLPNLRRKPIQPAAK